MNTSELAARLADVRGVMLDIDGCLVLSDRPAGDHGSALPGATELIESLKASGRSVVVFTNGSHRTPAQIGESLRDMGLDLSDDEVMTPPVVAAETVAALHPGRPVLVFGNEAMVSEFAQRGIPMVDHDEAFEHGPGEVAAVVVGWDEHFGRAKIQISVEAIRSGAEVYVTSAAPTFASSGRVNVGVTGFIGAGLEHSTGKPYQVLGKPSDFAMAGITERLGTEVSETLVVGDDLYLEASMARASGALSCLVTTGMNSAADAAAATPDRSPDFVVDSLHELRALLLDGLAPATGAGRTEGRP